MVTQCVDGQKMMFFKIDNYFGQNPDFLQMGVIIIHIVLKLIHVVQGLQNLVKIMQEKAKIALKKCKLVYFE